MNIRRLIIAVLCVAFLSACKEPLITYPYVTEFVFENNSSHDIFISRDGFDNSGYGYEESEISIKSFETIMVTNGMGVTGLFGRKCIVNFGNQVIVDYNQLSGSQYSLLDVDNYEFVSYRKGTTRRKYTFTDADYQFALENGTKLENK